MWGEEGRAKVPREEERVCRSPYRSSHWARPDRMLPSAETNGVGGGNWVERQADGGKKVSKGWGRGEAGCNTDERSIRPLLLDLSVTAP